MIKPEVRVKRIKREQGFLGPWKVTWHGGSTVVSSVPHGYSCDRHGIIQRYSPAEVQNLEGHSWDWKTEPCSHVEYVIEHEFKQVGI